MDTVDEDILSGFFFSPVYLINENVFQKVLVRVKLSSVSVAPPAVLEEKRERRAIPVLTTTHWCCCWK